jgi:hypothetical protein
MYLTILNKLKFAVLPENFIFLPLAKPGGRKINLCGKQRREFHKLSENM